jgi:hypothetical protein
LLLQKKVTKVKESGKDNLSLFVRLLRRPSRATKKAEVRAFSGLPTHSLKKKFCLENARTRKFLTETGKLPAQ